MGGIPRIWILLLIPCSLLSCEALALLCADSSAPAIPNGTLKFCRTSGGGKICCDAAADAVLQARFKAMDIKKDGECAGLIKSILCAKCNQFSADLFNARTVPLLCSSTSLSDPRGNYCGYVWNHCNSTAISNSPFQGYNAEVNVSSSMLTDFWASETEFCAAFSGTANKQESVCFNGEGVSFQTRVPSRSPKGLCLEKIANGSYFNMAAHPDGSNRAFFSTKQGKILFATIPEQGTGDSLQTDENSPFLDLTNEDYLNSSDFGLMGIAFHPDFVNNGRFFVSYICDGTQSSTCTGRCSCDREVGCDPSKLGSDNGFVPCQYKLIVSEYSATKGSSSDFSEATYADPSEVRRIFSMGLTYASDHTIEIFFGPTDGYLFIVTGNGGKKGDPLNFSQNKKSLLGKILRLNVDDLPGLNGVANQSLWGNYDIPKDNPYTGYINLRPEIWASGLGTPLGCSFDSARPFPMYCADDDKEQYQVVYYISKGGTYGSDGASDDQDVRYKVPLSVGDSMRSRSIIGGYVYRGSADSHLYGRYLFAKVSTSAVWGGTVIGNGEYTSTSIPLSCSQRTPIPCDGYTSTSPLVHGSIISFGEDNKKDIFILTAQGVYRVVKYTLCDHALNTTTTTGGKSLPFHGRNLLRDVLILTSCVLAAVAGACTCKQCSNGNFCPINCCNDDVVNSFPTAAPTMDRDNPPAPPPRSIYDSIEMTKFLNRIDYIASQEED